MLTRTHIGVSLDGFVAGADGCPTWDALPTFQPVTHAYGEVVAQCEAVVAGRTSFDQSYEDWKKDWPWPGKRVYVLTSHPLPNGVRTGVVGCTGGAVALVSKLRAAGLKRDVLVLGGPRAVRALMDLGGLDRLGLVVLPILLRTGIPLFPIEPTNFSRHAWVSSLADEAKALPKVERHALRLERHRPFPDGALELVYALT